MPQAASFPKMRSAAAWILLSAALLFLSVWKGVPHRGYGDILQYFENTEAIWLKGELGYDADERAPGGRLYHRYPIGLSVLSGPFLFAGLAVERISGGAVPQRAVTAFIIPLLALAACALVVDLGRQLGVAPVPTLWSALMLAAASQVLTFSRLYYTEIAILFFVLLALAAFLRARRQDTPRTARWWFLAGTGLAGITACHYGDVALSAALGMVFAAAVLMDNRHAWTQRLKALAALGAVPLLAGLGIMAVNRAYFGSGASSGYHAYYQGPMFELAHLPSNLPLLGVWLIRNPWLLPALFAFPWLFRRERWLAAAVTAGLLLQMLLWVSFIDFDRFAYRYPMPLLALGVPALLLAAKWLHERLPRRGLAYAGLVLVGFNVLWFLRGEDIWPSFFTVPGETGVVRCHVWYMSPLPTENPAWGSPVGALQAAVLAALLAGSALSAARAFRLAGICAGSKEAEKD